MYKVAFSFNRTWQFIGSFYVEAHAFSVQLGCVLWPVPYVC